jgi:hypothetical protein
MQVGFCAEASLTAPEEDACNRGVLYGRYVLTYGSSLYLQPFQYVEAFGSILDNNLPEPDFIVPGARRFDKQSLLGLHYHVNYLTPYWDPEGGFQLDATYANGLPLRGQDVDLNLLSAQLSLVKYLPDWFPGLDRTRLAGRAFGAAGWPNDGEFFTLGGSQLFRGFDLSDRQGACVWVASVEWRLPVVQGVNWDFCDHVLGVRNVYVAPFYDVGAAYLKGQVVGEIYHAVGGGLRVDMAWFSFIERTIVGLDIAKTLNADTPLQFWFRVQHPF